MTNECRGLGLYLPSKQRIVVSRPIGEKEETFLVTTLGKACRCFPRQTQLELIGFGGKIGVSDEFFKGSGHDAHD